MFYRYSPSSKGTRSPRANKHWPFFAESAAKAERESWSLFSYPLKMVNHGERGCQAGTGSITNSVVEKGEKSTPFPKRDNEDVRHQLSSTLWQSSPIVPLFSKEGSGEIL
jgi:hypothetical protein